MGSDDERFALHLTLDNRRTIPHIRLVPSPVAALWTSAEHLLPPIARPVVPSMEMFMSAQDKLDTMAVKNRSPQQLMRLMRT